MAYSPTNRLGLQRPLTGQGFSRQWAYDLLTAFDLYPGVYPCTAATRPATWGAGQIGMFIFETDSGLLWKWTGAAFARYGPVGLLANPVSVTADFPTALTSPQAAISCAVTVPATTVGSTTKRIKIEASCYAIENGTASTLGVAEIAIMRDAAVLCSKRVVGRPSGAVLIKDDNSASAFADYISYGVGQSLTFWDNVAAGDYTYKFCVNSVAGVGGTTTMKASATQPAQLAVSEVGV